MTSNAAEGGRILGSLRSAEGKGIVRMEDRFDTEIDDVWSALTDPSRLARWYGEVEGDLRLGGEYRARLFASGWEGTGRVEACEPPQRLLVRGKEADEPGENETEVMLTADGDQTMVVWEARGMPLDLLSAYGAGVQIHVEDLADYLAGRDRRDDSKARWDQLHPTYHLLSNVRTLGHTTLTLASLAEVGRQVLVGRVELVPPRLGVVTAISPGEVVGEIFDVDLHPGPVSGEQVQGHPPCFPDHHGLVAVGGQHDLGFVLARLVRFLATHEQPLRGLARFDTPGAFPSAGEETCPVLTAEAQVALHLAVPTGQTRGVGECRPHVVELGVDAVFHTNDALTFG